jgi:putative NADPH-quinone reductase
VLFAKADRGAQSLIDVNGGSDRLGKIGVVSRTEPSWCRAPNPAVHSPHRSRSTTMARRIAIIQGHPDAQGHHFGHALGDAYATGARQAAHEVKTIRVAALDFSLLRRKEDWEGATPSEVIRQAQGTIGWADHLLIIYPLWLGSMPAILKAFLEQVFRPGFAFSKSDAGRSWKKSLSGKSARIVVTQGHAGISVSLVFSRPQPQEPGTKHSRLLRHWPHEREPHRPGRKPERREAGEMARQDARAGRRGQMIRIGQFKSTCSR